MAYFKYRPFFKNSRISKIGLFQKLAYFKNFAGAIIIGNVVFFFEKNATTFGNALYIFWNSDYGHGTKTTAE